MGQYSQKHVAIFLHTPTHWLTISHLHYNVTKMFVWHRKLLYSCIILGLVVLAEFQLTTDRCTGTGRHSIYDAIAQRRAVIKSGQNYPVRDWVCSSVSALCNKCTVLYQLSYDDDDICDRDVHPTLKLHLLSICYTTSSTTTHTHTHKHTYNCFVALWILSGTIRVSQYQKKHSPTHTYRGHQSSKSALSIYYDPWHPSCSIHTRDSLFPQSLSKFSLFYLLAWHPPLHTSYISSPNQSSSHNTCPYHRNLFCCSTEIMSSNPSLSLYPLRGILSSSFTPHIRLTTLISACWSATSFSFLTGQVSLLRNIQLRTQPLYNLPRTINDISLLVSNGTNCLNLFNLDSCAFSALTLLFGIRKSIRPVENWVMGYRTGVINCLECGTNDLQMVQLMLLPPHHLLLQWNPEWFYLSGAGLPKVSWKKGR